MIRDTIALRETISSTMHRAHAAEAEQDWAGATACWNALISSQPRSVPAWTGFGRVSLRTGKLVDGLTGFQIAAQYCVNDEALGMLVAREAAALGLWSIVRTVSEVLARAEQGGLPLALLRAEAMINTGNLSLARGVLGQVLQDDPGSIPALLLQARAQRPTPGIAKTETILHALLMDNPSQSTIRSALADNLIQRQQYDVALRLLDDARNIGAPNAHFLSLRGQIAEQLKDSDNATRYYNEAIALDPDHIETLSRLCGIHLRVVVRPLRALALAQRLLSLTPTRSISVVLFADANELLDAPQIALERLLDFHRAFPKDTRVGLRLPRLLTAVGEHREAVRIATAFTLSHPTSRQFSIALAIARASSGDWYQALIDIHEIYQKSKPEDLAPVLSQLFDALPDVTSPSLFSNAVLAKWHDHDLAVRMFELYSGRGRAEQALIWAEALSRSARDKITPALLRRMVSTARATGRTSLAEKWLSETSTGGISSEGKGSDAQQWYDQLRALVLSGQWATAETVVDKAYPHVVAVARTVRLKFEIAVLQSDPDRALAIAQTAPPSETSTGSVDLLSSALAEALRYGDISRAEDILASLVKAMRLWISARLRNGALFDYIKLITKHASRDDVEKLLDSAISTNYHRLLMLDVLAEHLQSQGETTRAITAIEAALAIDTRAFDRRKRYADLLVQQKRWSDANTVVDRQLHGQGSRTILLELYSKVLDGLGKIEKAEAALRAAARQSRDSVTMLRRLAAFLQTYNKLDEEIQRLRAHLGRFPQDHAARLRLAICLDQNGEWSEADPTFESLIETNRYDLAVLENHVRLRHLRMYYSGAQRLIAKFDLPKIMPPQTVRRINALHKMVANSRGSKRLLQRAIGFGTADSGINLALIEYLTEQSAPDDALSLVHQNLATNPFDSRIYLFKGLNHHQLGEVDAARAAFLSALFLQRTNFTAMMQLGLLEEEARNFDAALDWYNRAVDTATKLGRNPGGRTFWHRVMVAMITNRTDDAIAAYGAQCEFFNEAFPANITVWRGESLAGRNLVVAVRGGPGDELRQATMAFPHILAGGVTKCTFACDPRLYTLLARTFPEIEFVPTFSGHRQLRRLNEGIEPTHDRVWPGASARILEMAVPFGRMSQLDFICHSDTLVHETFFKGVVGKGRKPEHRFLVPHLDRQRQMRDLLRGLGSEPKIGLCWRGSFFSRYRDRGFLAIEDMAPLLKTPGVRFIDLQVNKTAEETAALVAAGIVCIPGLNLYDDFEGMAALISELDLVISPAVTLRDIAGALNVPVWSPTIIPGAADVWRRQADGRDRWQPSIMHYDLLTWGSRDGVIAAITQDLLKFRDAALQDAPQTSQAAE